MGRLCWELLLILLFRFLTFLYILKSLVAQLGEHVFLSSCRLVSWEYPVRLPGQKTSRPPRQPPAGSPSDRRGRAGAGGALRASPRRGSCWASSSTWPSWPATSPTSPSPGGPSSRAELEARRAFGMAGSCVFPAFLPSISFLVCISSWRGLSDESLSSEWAVKRGGWPWVKIVQHHKNCPS